MKHTITTITDDNMRKRKNAFRHAGAMVLAMLLGLIVSILLRKNKQYQ